MNMQPAKQLIQPPVSHDELPAFNHKYNPDNPYQLSDKDNKTYKANDYTESNNSKLISSP